MAPTSPRIYRPGDLLGVHARDERERERSLRPGQDRHARGGARPALPGGSPAHPADESRLAQPTAAWAPSGSSFSPTNRAMSRQPRRPTSSSTVKAAGTKTSDSTVDTTSPPITAIAMGERNSP